MQFNLRIIAVLALLPLTGCGGKKPEQPPPRVSSSLRDDPPPEQDREKRGIISRIFAAETPAGYAWDGNYTSLKVDAAPDAAYAAAQRALREMNFIVREEDSSRSASGGQLRAAKTDKTTVHITIERKTDKDAKTEIKAKVGVVGDRTGSERVIEMIQRALSAAKRTK